MDKYKNNVYKIERNFIDIENISTVLECGICCQIMNNPMRLDCGHTFCYLCIQEWRKRKNNCLNCRQIIVDSLISRDLLAYNLINELEVSCNNEDKGCPWKGKLLYLETHIKLCNDNIGLVQGNYTCKNKNIFENCNELFDLLVVKKPFYNTEIKNNKGNIHLLLINSLENREKLENEAERLTEKDLESFKMLYTKKKITLK